MKKVSSILLCIFAFTFCACAQKEVTNSQKAETLHSQSPEKEESKKPVESTSKETAEPGNTSKPETSTLDRTAYQKGNKYWSEVVSFDEANLRTDASRPNTPLLTSDSKDYTKEELQDYPKTILYLAKNEIYARHGYIFKDTELQNYFLGQTWYEPEKESTEFSDNVFNSYEKSNLKLIISLLDE